MMTHSAEAAKIGAMRIVIVGAGQAGGWAARTIANGNYGHSVVLVGEERHPPYERPPLSKEVLLGKMAPSETYMWQELHGIDARHGVSAQRIDREERSVLLSDGTSLGYDRLILATGGRVRRLDRPGVHYVRTIEDCAQLGAAMRAAKSMLVIGGGWIGLEVAAAGREIGLRVTVIEAADRLCVRAMPPVLSDYLHDLHVRNGVTFHYRAKGEDFESDVIVAGIGIVPNAELAAEAGLATSNGILVDAFGTTSDPNIFAAGDVASRDGLRIESWANAQNQAIAVACSAAGKPQAYEDVPWFWSTQYGVNMQFLGEQSPSLRPIMRGNPADDRFSLVFLDEENIFRGLAAVNNARDIRPSRKLIAAAARLDPERLADLSVPISETQVVDATAQGI